MLQVGLDRGNRIGERVRRRPVDEGEVLVGDGHALLNQPPAPPRKALERQRVQYFVREDDSAMRPGRLRQPLDARQQVGRLFSQPILLPLAQVGRDFHDRVTLGQCVQISQGLQDIDRQLAAAGAVLEHAAARHLFEHRRALARDDPAEQPGHFRSRHEVARRPELRRARDVVAQPRRVQRMLHELGEPDRTAACRDLLADVRGDPFGMRCARRVRFWQ